MRAIMKKVFFLFLIMTNIGCDQITKQGIRDTIEFGERIELVRSNLVLTKVENTGAAMGFGSNFPPIIKELTLKFIPLFILLGLTWYTLIHKNIRSLTLIAIALIVGGGLGNLIDRFRFASETDFLFVHISFFKTGIFNMADVSVTLGSVILLITQIPKK